MASEFTVVRERSLDLPDGQDIDVDVTDFPVPGVKSETFSILAFRLRVTGNPRLRVTLNGHELFSREFTAAADRSYHEVVERNTVRETGNKLTLTRVSGPGSVHMSNLVLFYHR